MLIYIRPDELEPEFINNWKLGYITQPSIDYADNAIYAVYNNEQVKIFFFGKFGYVMDNRFTSYDITAGKAGITINIIRN
jgi:hypothetical protein